MPLSLDCLPYDVLFNIAQFLNFNDIFHLRQQSKQMMSLLSEETICRKVVETHINHTPEADLANARKISFREALNRVHARREALATGRPVSVTQLGYGASFLYKQGVVCYRVDDPARIRVLDIHKSSKVENVIDIASLVGHAVKGLAPNQQGTLSMLHYSDGILVCLFEARKFDPWLIAVEVSSGKCLAALELETAHKIFVRHNSEYLLYGTHTYTGSRGHREWVIQGYNLKYQRPFDNNIYLDNLVGCDIGLTVAFEIHRGYFYAVSNQTSFEVEEVDWTSYYHGYRFPLEEPKKKTLKMERWWRRNHIDGPINDSWTDFRLHVDESTGDLSIVEARREWQDGGSDSRRTYYTRAVEFPNKEHPEDSFMIERDPQLEQDEPQLLLPDEQLARLVDPSNKPQYRTPHHRHPRNFHPGDDDTGGGFILARTKLRYYNPDANTFLDLVNDPEYPPRDGGFRPRQRLRLRIGSRRLCAPQSDAQEIFVDNLPEVYESRGIVMWPPEPVSEEDDELTDLLNPLGGGDVEGVCDERSLIYMTGDEGQPRALVLINFDVGINLVSSHHGIRTIKGVGETASNPGRADGRVVAVERKPDKGKGKVKRRSVSPVLGSPFTEANDTVPYFRVESATYVSLKSLRFKSVV